MQPEIVKEKPTPTDILMRCMEEFGDDEAEDIVVIWTTKGGDIAWSTSARVHQAIGMMSVAESRLLRHFDEK